MRTKICDVTLRDGIQVEERFIPSSEKVAIGETVIAAGIIAMQFTSFVNPKRMPQFSDAAVVAAALSTYSPNLEGWVFVANAKGAERALKSGHKDMYFAITATESYNRRNVGMSIADSLSEANVVIQLAAAQGGRVVGAIGVAFGCPIEGPVPSRRVLALAEAMRAHGAWGIQYADTAGQATPTAVRKLIESTLSFTDWRSLSLHFHDTLGRSLLNAFVAIESGVGCIDAALGGVGGSPVSRSAGGNVCLENLVLVLEAEGVATGIDVDQLMNANKLLRRAISRDVRSHAEILLERDANEQA